MEKVSIKQLKELIKESKDPVFVKFATKWCGVCKLNAPIVQKMADKYAKKGKFVEVDPDDEKAWDDDKNDDFSIKLVPTYFIFKDGKEVWTQNNFIGEPVLDKILAERL